jgi:hypothetical protein
MDASVLMLLSGLSPHTRHLRADKRCSIMVVGPATGPNPQTAPRLSLVGEAEPEPSPALKARWIALHPYAAFYAGLSDFQLWRFRAGAGQFVGGFASAHRLGPADLQPSPDAVSALEQAEAGMLQECGADPDRTDLVAGAGGGTGRGWNLVALDPDGCDLAREETVLRIAWAAPASSANDVRTRWHALADAARNHFAPGPRPAV